MSRLHLAIIGALLIAAGLGTASPQTTRLPLVMQGVYWAHPSSPPAPSGCSCTADTLSCTNFDTQSYAQACFEYCEGWGVGDIHGLDQDEDGVACENLPDNFRVAR